MLLCFKSLYQFLYAKFNKLIILIVVLLLNHQEALEIQLFDLETFFAYNYKSKFLGLLIVFLPCFF